MCNCIETSLDNGSMYFGKLVSTLVHYVSHSKVVTGNWTTPSKKSLSDGRFNPSNGG